jgi:hypothetical protein
MATKPMTVAEAVSKFGSMYHVAKILGISQSAVGRWGEMVPQHRAGKLHAKPAKKLQRGGFRAKREINEGRKP